MSGFEFVEATAELILLLSHTWKVNLCSLTTIEKQATPATGPGFGGWKIGQIQCGAIPAALASENLTELLSS
jgi:hypothetical protein